jgi:hypothetical protein
VLFACDSPATILTKSFNLIQKKLVEKPLPSSQLRQPPPITEALPANVVGSPAKKKGFPAIINGFPANNTLKCHTTIIQPEPISKMKCANYNKKKRNVQYG